MRMNCKTNIQNCNIHCGSSTSSPSKRGISCPSGSETFRGEL